MSLTKKIISAILATGIALSSAVMFVPLTSNATTVGTIDEDGENQFDDGILTYTKGDNFTVSVTGCESTATSVAISSEIDGYKVTSIGEGAFSNCTEIMAITLPDTIETLGEGSFYGCTSLESMEIPSSVETIPSGTFAYCTSLKEVTLDEGVTTIDSMAFSYCESLETITIPETVTSIGDYAFQYCTSLKEQEIPSGVTEFTNGTFYGCSGLETFTVPKNLTNIGNYPFLGCTSLKSIEVEDGNERYVSVDGVLFTNDMTLLEVYPCGNGETSYTLPDETTEIAPSAFFSDTALTEITFNDKLKYIDEGAFDFCTNLKSITIPASTVEIMDNAFSDCTQLAEVNLSEGLETIDQYAFYCCTSLTSVIIPESVTSIGDYAFGYNESETETDEDGNYEAQNIDDFKIYGYSPSHAKRYASRNGIKFVSLNFDMSKVVTIVLLVALFIVVVVVVSKIFRKRFLESEKRKAFAEAEKAIEDALNKPDDAGRVYKSIVDSGSVSHSVTHSTDSTESTESSEEKSDAEAEESEDKE